MVYSALLPRRQRGFIKLRIQANSKFIENVVKRSFKKKETTRNHQRQKEFDLNYCTTNIMGFQRILCKYNLQLFFSFLPRANEHTPLPKFSSSKTNEETYPSLFDSNRARDKNSTVHLSNSSNPPH